MGTLATTSGLNSELHSLLLPDNHIYGIFRFLSSFGPAFFSRLERDGDFNPSLTHLMKLQNFFRLETAILAKLCSTLSVPNLLNYIDVGAASTTVTTTTTTGASLPSHTTFQYIFDNSFSEFFIVSKQINQITEQLSSLLGSVVDSQTSGEELDQEQIEKDIETWLVLLQFPKVTRSSLALVAFNKYFISKLDEEDYQLQIQKLQSKQAFSTTTSTSSISSISSSLATWVQVEQDKPAVLADLQEAWSNSVRLLAWQINPLNADIQTQLESEIEEYIK